MKQRILSVVVTDSKGSVLFQKNPATPQDLMAILTLFEGDGVVVEVSMKDVDVQSSSAQQN